jgi:stringent starvation protein B
MHEWMIDGGQTPHIVVNALADGVEVPQQHIKDGKIILNIGYDAVKELQMGNDIISFEARFSGKGYQISLPVSAVQGIYARESSQGMVFPDEGEPSAEDSAAPAGNDKTKSPKKPGGSHLKIVK